MSFLPLWQRPTPWIASRVGWWRRARKLVSNPSAYCPVGALQIIIQIQIQKLINILESKLDDPELAAIHSRLLTCGNMVEAKARVHYECNRLKALNDADSRGEIGRPADVMKVEYFERMCQEIEKSPYTYTQSEAHALMVRHARGSEDAVYSKRHMLVCLREKYGHHLTVCSKNGRSNLLCFSNMVDYLITDKWYEQRQLNKEDDATRIINMATKLLITSMKEKMYSKQVYPIGQDVSTMEKCLGWLPDLVRVFLSKLIPNELQHSSWHWPCIGRRNYAKKLYASASTGSGS